MFNFEKIKDFWCIKVLPTVYEDSLSYYEVLCKLTRKVNEIIDKLKELPDYIKQLINEAMANYEIPLATKDKVGGIYAEDGSDTDSVMVRIKKGFLYVKDMSYTLVQAKADTLGGVKAADRTAEQTEAVGIDPTTGILYVKPAPESGGSGGLEGVYNINDFEGDDVVTKIENAQSTLAVGATVLFPVGEYLVTRPIVLWKRLKFVGVGGILSWERPKFVFQLDGTSTMFSEVEYDWTRGIHLLVTDFVFENINFSYETALTTDSTHYMAIFDYNPLYAEDESRTIAIRNAVFECSSLVSGDSNDVVLMEDQNDSSLQTLILDNVRIGNGFSAWLDINMSNVELIKVYTVGITGYHAQVRGLMNLHDLRSLVVEGCNFNENILGSQSNYVNMFKMNPLDKSCAVCFRNSRFDVSMCTSWLGYIISCTSGGIPAMSAIGCEFIFSKGSSSTSYGAIENSITKNVDQLLNNLVVIGCTAKGCDPRYVCGSADILTIRGCCGIGAGTGYMVIEPYNRADGVYYSSNLKPTFTVSGGSISAQQMYMKDGIAMISLNIAVTAATGTISVSNTKGKIAKFDGEGQGIITKAANTYGYYGDGTIVGSWYISNSFNNYGADVVSWNLGDTDLTDLNIIVDICMPMSFWGDYVAA